MLKYAIAILILAGLSGQAAEAADAIGFREVTLPDVEGSRPLNFGIWYPADAGGPQMLVGDNAAFVGLSVAREAKPQGGSHPLVVISHGYGGNWWNQNWLASDLVRNGYVVAAPNHPGTTTFDKRPSEAARLWERPHDVSRIIDALAAKPSLAGRIATKRIAAIGHSLGGWTVIQIAGGRFDTDRLAADCTAHSNLAACGVFNKLGIGQDAGSRAELGGDWGDDRVGAVVSLDLGLARGFTPASLAAIRVPVLVLAAGTDVVDVPAKVESGYLMSNLPAATSQYFEIPDAAHFSFMQPCKAGAAALLDEEVPGDGIICNDGAERDRTAIHRQVADMITVFLAEALPE